MLITQWRVNVVGPVFFTKALLPLLAKSSGKTVINISSFLGHTSFHEKTDGGVMYASYSATKAALDMANLKFHHECVVPHPSLGDDFRLTWHASANL